MTEKTEPDMPGAVRKHSLRMRLSGARLRVRRAHLIIAGGVALALVAGGVAWAAMGGGSGSSEATGPDPAPGSDATGPVPTDTETPPGPDTTDPGPDPSAGAPADGFPVPTWEPGPRPGGRGGGDGGDRRRGDRDRDDDDRRSRRGRDDQPPGMPSELRAERDGDTVVLRWTDNTNNEDGFAIFVAQGRTSYQVVVPADTTSYEVVTAARGGTCFAITPFTWAAPLPSHATGDWACTGRDRS